VGSPALTLLLDSNIIIDALNGIEDAVREVLSDPEAVVSVVAWVEVLAGYRDGADAAARELLKTLTVADLSPAVLEETLSIRRATRLKLPDAIILATARVHGLTLSTRNTRDFDRNDPSVRIPYEL
jgi:predicted nucleic acid-binding protein